MKIMKNFPFSCGLFMFVLLAYLTVTQTIEMSRSSTISDSTECTFLTMSYFAFFSKWLNITFRRKKLLDLRNRLSANVCQPRCTQEKQILENTARRAAWYFWFCIVLGISCGISFMLLPFAKWGQGPLELPYKTYHFFNESNPFYFTVIYLVQGLGVTVSGAIHGSFDNLCYGFLITTTGCFELCCYRLTSYVKSGDIDKFKKEWIDHHIYVQNTVRAVESVFIYPTVILFVTSLFSICTSIFVLSQLPFGSFEFLLSWVYLVALLYEVFIYCFLGTHLEHASQQIMHAAYESEWTELEPRHRKILQFMMMISNKGSTISYRGQCCLYLSTFVSIVKTSYGAFNLLQGVSFQ